MCRGSLREPIFRRVCAPEHHESHAPGRHVRVVRARVRRGGARLAWHDSKKTLTKAKHTKESVCAARTPLGSSRPHPQPLSRVASARRRSRRGVGSCSAASSRPRNGGHDEVQVEYLRPRGRRTRRKSRRGFLARCAARRCSTHMRAWGSVVAAGVVQSGGGGMHACLARLCRACRCAARDIRLARGQEALCTRPPAPQL